MFGRGGVLPAWTIPPVAHAKTTMVHAKDRNAEQQCEAWARTGRGLGARTSGPHVPGAESL
jgi:hypothetical protein